MIARISIVSFFAFIFLMFSVTSASAGDKEYSAPTWKYDSSDHEYRRFDKEHRGDYHRYERRDWRNTFYDESYDDYRGPLSRERLILEINSQGYFWVYNIRPSFRHNYVTAYAFDRRYGGRSVYLRINQFNGHVFYFRYN